MCEQKKTLRGNPHVYKKGIFEFFFVIQFEGEIVVERKLKVKYRKNEFKKKEIKKINDQAKTETKDNGECET